MLQGTSTILHNLTQTHGCSRSGLYCDAIFIYLIIDGMARIGRIRNYPAKKEKLHNPQNRNYSAAPHMRDLY